MEPNVKLTIDGYAVTVPVGTNLLEAAQTVGVEIPHLCYLKSFLGIGACRICLVEIAGFRAPVTACTTLVQADMLVITDSARLRADRKFVLDLILSVHPPRCGQCEKVGVCQLIKYASKYRIGKSTFEYTEIGQAVTDPNPFIRRDMRYCILCGKCVRICQGQGTNVLAFLGRGIKLGVGTPAASSLKDNGCTFCGSCVEVCPVSALAEVPKLGKGREIKYTKTASVCMQCGNACPTQVATYEDELVKVNALDNADQTTGYLCAVGRFGFYLRQGEKRLTTPLKKSSGIWQETDWTEALTIISQRFKKGNSGLIATGTILNQEVLDLATFAQATQISNLAGTPALYASNEALRAPAAQLEQADLIILVGLNPSQQQRVFPALDAVIKSRVRQGAKLVVLNDVATGLGALAEVEILDEPVMLLEAFGRCAGMSIPQDVLGATTQAAIIAKAAKLYQAAQNPVLLCEPAYYQACVNAIGNKGPVLVMPYEANAKGVALMLPAPEQLNCRELLNGGVDTLYIAGEMLAGKNVQTDFLIVQQPYFNGAALQADIVLPAPLPWEKTGTVVDWQGQLKNLQQACPVPPGVKTYRQVFSELGQMLGCRLEWTAEDAVIAAAQLRPEPVVRELSTAFTPALSLVERVKLLKELNGLVARSLE